MSETHGDDLEDLLVLSDASGVTELVARVGSSAQVGAPDVPIGLFMPAVKGDPERLVAIVVPPFGAAAAEFLALAATIAPGLARRAVATRPDLLLASGPEASNEAPPLEHLQSAVEAQRFLLEAVTTTAAGLRELAPGAAQGERMLEMAAALEQAAALGSIDPEAARLAASFMAPEPTEDGNG